MIETFGVKIDQLIEKSVFNKALTILDEQKQMKIRRFCHFQDAQRALIADILVRSIIVKKTKIKNKNIVFNNNKYGKPYFKFDKNFEFNIAHSGKWVVCAVHNSPVGIDIEEIQPIDFEIARRFFAKSEYDLLLNKENNEQLSYFYDLWSIKESYIKASGKGLSIPLNSFSIYLKDNDIDIFTKNEFNNCFFKQYEIDSKYKMAVCGCSEDFSVGVKYIELNQLLADISKM